MARETQAFADADERFHGGYGYMKKYKVERLYGDAQVAEICEGTSEMMRMLVAGNTLQPHYSVI